MSIFQEYEENQKLIGFGRIVAIDDYIKYYKETYNKDFLYSDIVYKQKEYELFDKWFEDSLKPFNIINHTDKYYSLILEQVYFDKELFNKNEVNGYDYEELIKSYVSDKLSYLENELNFDSEAGMFAVTSKDIKVIEELAYAFNRDLKNKNYIKLLLQDMELNYE